MTRKQITYPMGDIANLLSPLIPVMYTLQMARSREWTRDARIKWLKKLRDSAWQVYVTANNKYGNELRLKNEERRN